MWYVISPAYGRSYTSGKAAIADFTAGKDFIHQPSGRYISIQDFAKGDQAEIRYGKDLSKLAVHRVV